MERVHGRSIQYLWVYDGFSSEREIGGKREHLTKAGRDHQGLALWPGPSPSALRSRLAVVSCILTETASKARTASAPAELPLATHAKWGVWFCPLGPQKTTVLRPPGISIQARNTSWRPKARRVSACRPRPCRKRCHSPCLEGQETQLSKPQ